MSCHRVMSGLRRHGFVQAVASAFTWTPSTVVGEAQEFVQVLSRGLASTTIRLLAGDNNVTWRLKLEHLLGMPREVVASIPADQLQATYDAAVAARWPAISP